MCKSSRTKLLRSWYSIGISAWIFRSVRNWFLLSQRTFIRFYRKSFSIKSLSIQTRRILMSSLLRYISIFNGSVNMKYLRESLIKGWIFLLMFSQWTAVRPQIKTSLKIEKWRKMAWKLTSFSKEIFSDSWRICSIWPSSWIEVLRIISAPAFLYFSLLDPFRRIL